MSANDQWYCPACRELRQARKTMELWSRPDTLVIHLKRFSSSGLWREKIDADVLFPLRVRGMSNCDGGEGTPQTGGRHGLRFDPFPSRRFFVANATWALVYHLAGA